MLRGTTGGKGITGEFGSVGPQPLYRNTQTGAIVTGGGQPCPGCEVHRNRGGVIAFNIISGNNYLGCGAAENAALKVHGFSGEVVGNLIVENFGAHAGICIPLSVDSHSSRARADSAGMWFDDLWWDLRVSRNVVVSQSDSDWAGTSAAASACDFCSLARQMAVH